MAKAANKRDIVKRNARWLGAVLIIVTFAVRVTAENLPETKFLYVIDKEYKSQVEKSRKRVEKFLEQTDVPGVAVALYKDDRIIWSEVWGYADLESEVPVNNKTRFRIASISKAVTSIALGKLYEEGKLDWDDMIQEHLSYFPDKRWPMTIRQVAGHIGGIRTYRGNEYLQRDHFNDLQSAIQVIKNDTLDYEPGTKYQYSSYGINVISGVIEETSGMEFLSYLDQVIFTPLGLDSFAGDHVDSLITNRARPYIRNEDGTILNAPYVDNSIKWAGGGLLASAEDVALFGAAVMNAKVLKRETIETLWQEQALADSTKTGYGMCWSTWKVEDEIWIGHGGGPVGGAAMLFMNPKEKLVYVMLCNMQATPLYDKNSRIILEPFMK